MAQLSDDCFAFGGPMLSVDETGRLVASRLSPTEELETVALHDADGRILAADLVAGLALPPFTNSAVDGYAVGGTDVPLTDAVAVTIATRVQAGASGAAVRPGTAARIFTGAPMPEGADTVFMQEDVRLGDDGRVVLPAGLRHGANVRPAGEDVALGHTVLRAGHRLRPQDVALAAALGHSTLVVRARVRVAIFSTGDEIVEPGAPRGPAQLHDSNRFMLAAMNRRLGALVTDLGILPDDPDLIAETLRAAATGHDLILTSGGVSTGEADHVKTSVERVGSLVFWRVAIKPGRPVAMGVISGTPFIGLPGNPVASFVTFAMIARPAIAALGGAAPETLRRIEVRAAFRYRKKAGRREFVRVGLTRGTDGVLAAAKFPREGAGLLSSLVETDGLVELDEETIAIEPGAIVSFLPYASLI